MLFFCLYVRVGGLVQLYIQAIVMQLIIKPRAGISLDDDDYYYHYCYLIDELFVTAITFKEYCTQKRENRFVPSETEECICVEYSVARTHLPWHCRTCIGLECFDLCMCTTVVTQTFNCKASTCSGEIPVSTGAEFPNRRRGHHQRHSRDVMSLIQQIR